MYEESVDAALNYGWDSGDESMVLANEMARKPELVERKKMLMKQIVEFFVERKKIALAMETVQKCPDLLSIEDIIKDLPDEMQIGEISKDLCHSLDQSKKKKSNNSEIKCRVQKKLPKKLKKTSKTFASVKSSFLKNPLVT